MRGSPSTTATESEVWIGKRFTPRKRTPNWSNVNIANVERLEREGLMHPPGARRSPSAARHAPGSTR